MILVSPVQSTNMHDFHLADQILKIVLEYAQKNDLKNIKKIELELGSILEHDEIIPPENLIFNFKLLSKNTIAETAELNIKKIARPQRQQADLLGGQTGDSWKLISIEE